MNAEYDKKASVSFVLSKGRNGRVRILRGSLSIYYPASFSVPYSLFLDGKLHKVNILGDLFVDGRSVENITVEGSA